MIQRVLNIFRKSKFYLALRYSWLHDLYTQLKYHAFFKHKVAESEMYTQIIKTYLPENPLIFDIGANIGDLSIAFKKAGARVVSVEPDPINLTHLRFRNKKALFTIEPIAIGNIDGQIPFYVHLRDNALSTAKTLNLSDFETTTVESQKMQTLIAKYGIPDFIKIDAEGFEWPILQSLSLPIQMLCFEINFPEFQEEAIHIINHLHTLSPDYKFNISTNDENLSFEKFIDIQVMLSLINNYKGKYAMIFCLLEK